MRRLPHFVLLLPVLVALGALASCRRDQPHELQVAVIGAGPLELGDATSLPAGMPQAVLRASVAQGLVRFDAGGQVEPGLAERWNVSDDGLSYIFRLTTGEWPDGRRIMARDVAKILNRILRAKGNDATRDALGAVNDIVAMTDRVIEIRLDTPRSNLLQLLAQPDFALIREGVGTGPFARRAPNAGDPPEGNAWRLRYRPQGIDGEPGLREDARLSAMPAATAVAAFRAGTVNLVLGGTVVDLPLATRIKPARGTLHFDPVGGLFGLVPLRADGPLTIPELRRLLSEAIDRPALVAALGVPGLVPRATLLQSGLEGLPDPVQPAWLAQPIADRRAALQRLAGALLPSDERLKIVIALPEGPGAERIFARLFADWGALGITLDRAMPGRPADLGLIDMVAPSTSPAWFVRQFRCGVAAVCLPATTDLVQAARDAQIPVQRAALLAQAAEMIDSADLFIPLTAPIRWSLVGDRATGFIDNRFGRHSLVGISRQGGSRGYTP